ncbi:CRISPR-associated endonuclease Cas1, partial [Candidatus Poribacteria bacterium]|nr:CRISPR-associated endonuclease Cas1 [Candidatus Poribacteria bacterium]
SLSLPTIKDKIVQQAVKDIVEPIICKDFLDCSYAYRENKGPVKAINRVMHLINNEKREWVTLCDIDKYFDNVDHDLLFSMLAEKINDEKILSLIHLWIKMGKVDSKMIWKDTDLGIPQGSVVSPLFSNFYLHPFDLFMTEKNFGYIRYADDFIVLSRSEGEAYHALKDTEWFLKSKLKLSLNPGSKVEKAQNGFVYLGILFTDSGVTINNEKKEKLKNKINDSIDLKEEKPLEKLIETIRGIDRYYAKFLSQNVLEEFDEWTVSCLKKEMNDAYNIRLLRKIRLKKRKKSIKSLNPKDLSF